MAEAYNAGTALLDVLPSLKSFNSRLKAELKGINPVMDIGLNPDVTGLRTKVKEVVSGVPPVKVKVDVDEAALKRAQSAVVSAEKRMADARAQSTDATDKAKIAEQQLDETRAKPKVKPSQISAAELKVAQARRAAATATNDAKNAEAALNTARGAVKDAKAVVVRSKIEAEADTAPAESRLKAFAASVGRRYAVAIGVDADVTGARRTLALFQATAARGHQVTWTVNVNTGRALAQMTALEAKAAGIGAAVVGGVGLAGAAFAALPAAIVAVLGPVGALAAGLHGVGDALKAYSDADDQAAQNASANAQQQVAAARQIASAQREVQQAKVQLARTYQDADWASAASVRQVQDAERGLITAEKARLQAQEAVTRAVEDARRAQQALAFQVAGDELAERAAALDLVDAQQALDAARANGQGGEQLDRAQLAYEQQKLTLEQIQAENKNLATDKAASDKAGVAGSQQVVSAQQQVAQSTQGVADAQRGVADAQDAAAQQQIQSQRAVADAQQQVAQAQAQLSQSIADSGNAGAAATDKIHAAMAGLSPSAQEFVRTFQTLRPEFTAVGQAAQEALFKNLAPAFSDFAHKTLPATGQNLAMVTGSINGLTQQMLGFLSTKESIGQFHDLFAGISQVIDAAAGPLQTWVSLFLKLAVAAMPGIVALVKAFGQIGTALLNAFQPLIDSGAITQAVTLLAQLIGALAPIIATVLSMAIQLWNAFGPALIAAVGALAPVLAALGQMLIAIAPTLGVLVQLIVSALLPVMQALAPVIAALAPVITQLLGVALQILVPLLQAAAKVALALMPAIQGIANVISALMPILVPLIMQLTSALLPIVQALTPVVLLLANVIAQYLTAYWSALVPVVTALVQALVQIIPALLGILQSVMPLVPVFFQLASTLITSLLPILPLLANLIVTVIQAFAPLLPQLVQLALTLMPALIQIIQALMPIITFLANILTGVLGFALRAVVVPLLQAVVAAAQGLGSAFSWLVGAITHPIDTITSAFKWAWDHIFKPVFDWIGTAIDKVSTAFTTFGSTVSGIWAGIKHLVHDGIQGIVDLIYNNGIRALANAVIKYIPGVDYLPEIKIPEFATGGVVPGYGPGRDVVPAMLSPGEAVLVPELVRMIGPAAILAANSAAMRGRGFSHGGLVGGRMRFAGGGIVPPASATTTPSSPGATAVTIDPAALSALGLATDAVTASITALALQLTTVLVPAITAVQIRSAALALAIVTDANAVWARQVLLQQQETASWLAITNSVWVSQRSQQAAFTALASGLAAVRSAMTQTANWATTEWGRIRKAAADPVRWVLQQPFNAGLIMAWNRLNSDFALGKAIKPIPVGFAAGGYVSGPGTGTSDSIRALLSDGEFVVRAAVAKRALPFLQALNSGQAEALQATGARRYAKGGLVADTGGQYNAMVARGLAFARAQDGKPYVWGTVGPDAYDCSGLMSAVTNVLRGATNPYQRVGVAASEPWPGFVPGLSSLFGLGGSQVHTAGTLAGVNIESTGTHVRFGGDAHGATDGQFPVKSSLPLVGGKFILGGGSLDLGALVGPYFADTYRLIGRITSLYASQIMAAQARGVATTATDRVRAAGVSALTAFGSTTATAGSPQVMAAVRAVAATFGWGTGPEWNALSWIIGHESGWNPAAANPNSSARGLFQKMTSVHGPLEPTITGQARWGLGYIHDDYGDPLGAQRFWQSHGFYDQGGVASGIGLMPKNILEPERVLSPPQTRAFDTLVSSIVSGGSYPVPAGQGSDQPAEFTGRIYLDDGTFAGVIDGRIARHDNDIADDLGRGRRI